jgi:hypothetical protein
MAGECRLPHAHLAHNPADARFAASVSQSEGPVDRSRTLA